MKRSFVLAIFCFGMIAYANTAKAQTVPSAQPWGHKMSQRLCYFYYPSVNVYFDAAYDKYVYQKGNDWVRSAVLPENIVIEKAEKPVRIDYIQDDVYIFNEDHRAKYQTKAQKTAYGKSTTLNKGYS